MVRKFGQICVERDALIDALISWNNISFSPAERVSAAVISSKLAAIKIAEKGVERDKQGAILVPHDLLRSIGHQEVSEKSAQPENINK